MTTATPEQRQREAALLVANRKRSARAQLRRSIQAGRTRVAQVLIDPPPCLETSSKRSHNVVTVSDVLEWQHRWGRARAHKFLRSHGVSPTLGLLDLSDARRKRLADALATA